MQVGIQKQHENEWRVQIGNSKLRLDRFSVELLKITLEHSVALEHGQQHSTLQSYVKLGMRLNDLAALDLQKVLRNIQQEDLVLLLRLSKDRLFVQKIIDNIGVIVAKQIEQDLERMTEDPDHDDAKDAIRRIIETTFSLESSGQIEFTSATETQYI